MPEKLLELKREFVEEMGLFVEQMGLPPMAGRIWGWLLVCDPPHQTAGEIAEAVGSSRGSISTMTRTLVQFGLIERMGVPGESSRYFRVKPDGFTDLLSTRMLHTAEIGKMAERGLEMLKDEAPEVRERLQEYSDFCAYFVEEFPVIIEKWKTSRRK